MGRYLNSSTSYVLYKGQTEQPYFVDKSQMLSELFPFLDAGNIHICIMRPRGFGKTVMANMITAFLGKKQDSDSIFKSLKISQNDLYNKYRNQYNVISIDFSKMPRDCDSYADYIDRIETNLIRDLRKEYPQIEIYEDDSAADVLETIFEECDQQRFVFVLDEWDFIFHKDFVTEENKKQYVLFLSNLLKDRSYVQLTYMTGILPIAKYSSGSELNMFWEYTMASEAKYNEYFGFTDSEVDQLYEKYTRNTREIHISREDLKEWYDGYTTKSGERMYNPRSVVLALTNNNIGNYWTSSGPYDEIFYYIRQNIDDVQNDLALMISGEAVTAKIQEYAAVSMNLTTKNEIFSAMIVYGFLSYEDGKVRIPNRELMNKILGIGISYDRKTKKMDIGRYLDNIDKKFTRKETTKMKQYDYLIVGSGLYGAVFAQQATAKGKKVLVIDKRPNIAGNVYTEDIEKIHVHKYGAHIFHTNNKKVWNYITKFAEFNRFTNSPVANYKGELYSLPFNMYTFNKMWGVITPQEAADKIEQQKKEAGITEPKNLEEQAISLVGTDIYEKLIKGYTEKQWGRPCTELPSFIIKRLPVRLTFDNNYFNALYQGIPVGGYTKMIANMLGDVEVRLNTDYFEHKEELDALAEKVIYTGPIDAYFDYKLGELEYRSVRFETEVLDQPNFQGNAAVNYTDAETPWTRIIEHKWFEFGKDEEGNDLPKTVISREYSSEWKLGDEPYYPVNDEKNGKLYEEYKKLAEKEENIIFGGRLGEYKYYDMDAVIAAALDMCEKEL